MEEGSLREFPGAFRNCEVRIGDQAPEVSPGDISGAWEELEDVIRRFSAAGLVTIVVNDATRFPAAPMLKPLEKMLNCDTRVIFATGTHRPVTLKEKEVLLGGCFEESPWKSFDCDAGDLVHLGITSEGTPVYMDPWLFDGFPIIAINTVEPHYFAGFTGGRKSFIPGLSGRSTIVNNHFLACMRGSDPGKLEGNPVHRDMSEALDMLEERVEILQGNGVLQEGRLVAFYAGDCSDSFSRAAAESWRLSRLPIPFRPDLLVLHPGEPLHVSLYQSEKAIYNCSHVLRDGGRLLLVSPCPEGLGADHLRKAFISSMDPRWEPPKREEYSLGDHVILRLKEMRKRFRPAFAGDLPDELVEEMGMEPVRDVASWVRKHDTGSTVFIPSAGFVVPVLEET